MYFRLLVMKRLIFSIPILVSLALSGQNTQTEDSAAYENRKEGFYTRHIMKSLYPDKSMRDSRLHLKMQHSENYPTDMADYDVIWHSIPKSQGNAGTCWCYAATSFFESEWYRIHEKKTDISEIYFVYHEYLIRILDYVDTKGETYFAQGSEANALLRLIPSFGVLPEAVYRGKADSLKFHNHSPMMKELNSLLEEIKEDSLWDKDLAEKRAREVLDKYLGEPPYQFKFEGKKYSPEAFRDSLFNIPMSAYQSVMSTMSKPYFEEHELVEKDNWWHGDNYLNLPPKLFLDLCRHALNKGYTICICGDVSEPGLDAHEEVAVIPDFDISSLGINKFSREMRLANGATTDDHCVHMVGMQETDAGTWFLLKDSGSGGFTGNNKGYLFFHEDYILLKMMNILVHKDVLREMNIIEYGN